MEHHEEEARVGRGASMAATLPLGVIAVTFFMPFVKTCSNVPSPLEYIQKENGSVGTAAWVAPPFLVAGLLFLVTLIALARRQAPGKVGWAAGIAGVAACLGSAAIFGAMLFHDGRERLMPSMLHVAFPAATIALAAAAAFFLPRAGSWMRWVHLIASYTALASIHCFWVVGALTAKDPWQEIGMGGALYLASILVLGGICLRALWMRRKLVTA